MKNAIEKKSQPIDIVAPLHFLLNCSDVDLGSFQNARLNEAANARTKLHEDLDHLLDELAQAALANFFRAYGRKRILKALQENPDPIADAKLKIKNAGRSGEELVPLLPLPPAAVKANRVAASIRYQEKNAKEGKCSICPTPRARHSVLYCEKHLAACRERARARARSKKPALPATAHG
jgi:hypothetical protein